MSDAKTTDIEEPKAGTATDVDPDKKTDDKPVEQMTPEEMEASRARFNKAMFSSEPLTEEDDDPEPVRAKPESKKDDDPAPKPEDTPAKKTDPDPTASSVRASTRPIPDIDDLDPPARAAAPEPVAQPAAAMSTDMNEDEKELLAVFEKMAEMKPAVYGQLPAQFKDRISRESQYITNWMEQNPGQRYNAKDQDHAEFYSSIELDYRDFDYHKAIAKMNTPDVDSRVQKLERELESKRESQELDDRIRRAEPVARREAANAAFDMMEHVDPELGKLMDDGNGGRHVTTEIRAKMEEDNPVAVAVVNEEVGELMLMVEELERFKAGGGRYKLRDSYGVTMGRKTFYPHREILDFMTRYEESLLNKPPEETMREGRRLVSSPRLAKEIETRTKGMSRDDADREIRRLDKHFYSLGLDDFKSALISERSALAKERVDRYSKGVQKPVAPTESEPKPNAKPVEQPPNNGVAERNGKRTEPQRSASHVSTSSSSDRRDAAAPTKKSELTTGEVIARGMFGN